MTIDGIEKLLPWIGAIAAMFSLASHWHFQITKWAKTELKVDTLWDFQMRRAQVEAIKGGIATINSPIVFSEEAKKWMSGVAVELREFYGRLGRHMSPRDLAVEIERRFGERILHEVCIPNGLNQGACLLLAAAVAEELKQGESAAKGNR